MSTLWLLCQQFLPLVLIAGTVYVVVGLFNVKRRLDLLLAAGIVAAGIIGLLAEILSVFHMLTLVGLILGHSLLLIGVLFLWWRRHGPRARLLWNWRSFWQGHFQGELLLQIMALAVAGILVTSLVVAVVSPPNNADSMTYHMARVGYWRQHASLEHYYANVERQNNYPPGAEILALWTVLVSGSDRWANSIQYVAFLGSLLAVYGVARRLGFEKRQSMFALLGAATVPPFILEATSTQNDLVMGYFLISSLYFLLAWRDENRREFLILSCWAGGLSVVVKSLSGIYLPFFALTLLLAPSSSWRRRINSVVAWGMCLALFLVFTSGPFLVRNIYSYGTPTGPTNYNLNENIALQSLIGNAYRHLALHVQFPPMPNKLPELADRFSSRVSEWLGIDLDDPATTMPGQRFHFTAFRPHEDSAGVGLPMLGLLVVAVGMFAISVWKGRQGTGGLAYLALLFLPALSFVAVFRWGPWNARYSVPLVLLFCPLLAILYQRTRGKSIGQVCLSYAVLGSIVLGLVSAIFNYSRPLLPVASKGSILKVPRAKIIYINRPWMQCVYQEALNSQAKVRRIGIHAGPDNYEYPLFGRHFERTLVPVPEAVVRDQSVLSDVVSRHNLDLVISTTSPEDSETFKERRLPIDCPENDWPDLWRRSTYLEGVWGPAPDYWLIVRK